MTQEAFLKKIKPYVIDDMKSSGILSSLTAAQAIVESSWGNSGLTKKGNNLFGIKGTYNGQSVTMKTTEYYNGVAVRIDAPFRKYPSWAESISDHSSLFTRLNRYKNLRGETNYKVACVNVQKDGYATSPTYSNTLISVINKYKLYDWDREVLNGGSVVLTPVTYPTLRLGMTDKTLDKNYIESWQNFLFINGYYHGSIDGIFGNAMLTAVTSWQKAYGLVPDGIVGKLTWNKCMELNEKNK